MFPIPEADDEEIAFFANHPGYTAEDLEAIFAEKMAPPNRLTPEKAAHSQKLLDEETEAYWREELECFERLMRNNLWARRLFDEVFEQSHYQIPAEAN